MSSIFTLIPLGYILFICKEREFAAPGTDLKNGFTLEGRRKNHLFYNGKWHDQLDFGIIIA